MASTPYLEGRGFESGMGDSHSGKILVRPNISLQQNVAIAHFHIHPNSSSSCCSHLEQRASVKRFILLQFLNLRQSVGLLGRGISPLQDRYLTQTQNKHQQTSKPWMEFEPTIPVFERVKAFHDLDRAAPVLGTTTTIIVKTKRINMSFLKDHRFSPPSVNVTKPCKLFTTPSSNNTFVHYSELIKEQHPLIQLDVQFLCITGLRPAEFSGLRNKPTYINTNLNFSLPSVWTW
jgi:hypothetical protein